MPSQKATGWWNASPLRFISAFEEGHGADAAVGADGDDGPLPRAHRGKLLHRLRKDAGACRAERMADRDAAPVRVVAVPWKASERPVDADLLADERFVLE